MAISINTNEDINIENRETINRSTDIYIINRPIPTFIDDVPNTVTNGNLLSEAVTIDWDSAIRSLNMSSAVIDTSERTILTEEPFELNEMRTKVNKLFDDCETIKKENKELKEALNKLKEEVRFLRET